MGSDENNNNLLDKLQDAIGRGQNPISIFPSNAVVPEIITISDPDLGVSGRFDFSPVMISNYVKSKKDLLLFESDAMINHFFSFSFELQDLVRNIHMIGFRQTSEQKNKKKKESRY